MQKKRAGFDFHGLVVDTQGHKEAFSEKFLGKHYPGAQLRRHLLARIGLSEKRYETLLKDIMENFSYFQHAQPHGDAVPVIQQLERDGQQLYLITASGKRAFVTAMKWCKMHDVFQPPSEMYSVDRYNSKAELVDALKLDVFVDNDLDQLTMIRRHFLNKEKIMPFLMLMTDQHNRDLTVPDGITRVDDWHKCYEYIHTLANIDSLLSR